MRNFLHVFSSAESPRRPRREPGPGPLARLACDYKALDTLAWALARRRAERTEAEAR